MEFGVDFDDKLPSERHEKIRVTFSTGITVQGL